MRLRWIVPCLLLFLTAFWLWSEREYLDWAPPVTGATVRAADVLPLPRWAPQWIRHARDRWFTRVDPGWAAWSRLRRSSSVCPEGESRAEIEATARSVMRDLAADGGAWTIEDIRWPTRSTALVLASGPTSHASCLLVLEKRHGTWAERVRYPIVTCLF